MATKFETVIVYVTHRFSEPETWRGVAVLASLAGGQFASLNWGECAALAGVVSGVMKIVFPTVVIPKDES